MPPDPTYAWPDGIDHLGIVLAAAVGFGLPAAGYVFAYVDFRAYLRSLRRALVAVRHYATGTPEWAQRDLPRCFAALGLQRGCTRDQVLAAYRSRVKTAHPDLGGSRRDFALLQRHFEEAMALAEAATLGKDR